MKKSVASLRRGVKHFILTQRRNGATNEQEFLLEL
jgi:hypothetical protein